ncbi:MAG TPA: DNA polymerase III subunit alpha [Anaerolineae bacterium]|nr:DNA polymerase III subunit alpha [Anaerolineae bacterium]
MPFIPLRVHSQWSLLAGVPSLEEIVAHAQQLQLPTLALTDVNALYGAIEFVQRCRAAQMQPILGVDFTFDTDHSLTLLAQNMTGYANLCRLVTRLQADVDRETRLMRGLSLTDLIDHTTGLIALSDGHHAARLIDLFTPDRFFLALDGTANAGRAALADQLGAPVVVAPDIRYLAADDASRFRVLTAMRTAQPLTELPDWLDYAFPSDDDLRQRFTAYPQALTNIQLIADRCCFEFPLGQYRFPTLDLPTGRSVRDELVAQTYAGAQQRYGAIDDRLEARLQKEIDVIDTLGYAPYFLVVADIVREARDRRVPVSPRGSASSSVVAYCLGIHDVDPIAHDLYFERFLSLERHDPPDIDLDLCSHRRDEVIAYVYRRYGADHVAMVCTYATLQPRSALREVGKVYGLSEARIGELANDLPRFWHPALRKQAHAAQEQLIEKARDPIEREVIAMSQALTNFPHHLSIHPGGIVISPGPITDLVPLQHATKGLLITQFDLKGIESLGLVKIDLLGISALTVAADCVTLIQQRVPDFRLEKIPLDDGATAQTLSSAQTIGCFQIESGGMRFTLRELAARSVDDLIVALALYRPGPLKGGLKDAFVRRHLGQEPTEYLHPALEPILHDTYGVVLYQEQVLRIAHEVAGFTLGEADLLRRAMSKFRSAHEMERLRSGFIGGAQRVSGLDVPTAEKLWDLLAAFAGYGFPKAHAAGYAALAYRLAYLKTHYPAEFFAARLAVWGGYYSPRVYMSEARQLGLSVQPPHINHSDESFTLDPIERRTLWMGLGQVRELTHSTIETILQQRPFTSLDDFLIRARPLQVEAVNLIKCGAMDGFGDRSVLLTRVGNEAWHGRHSPQLSLLTLLAAPATIALSLHQRAVWEHEILGYHVSVHPLDLCADRLAEAGAISSREIGTHLDRFVTLGGLRIAYHHVTSANESMLLVDMEDQAGLYQVLWGGAALRQARPLINQREPVLIRGRVRRDRRGLILIMGSEIDLLSD